MKMNSCVCINQNTVPVTDHSYIIGAMTRRSAPPVASVELAAVVAKNSCKLKYLLSVKSCFGFSVVELA
jgi:hypothetical protein